MTTTILVKQLLWPTAEVIALAEEMEAARAALYPSGQRRGPSLGALFQPFESKARDALIRMRPRRPL